MAGETGTMACTWHSPEHNGFHDLHNGHFWVFEQWLIQVAPTRPNQYVPSNGSKKRQ